MEGLVYERIMKENIETENPSIARRRG